MEVWRKNDQGGFKEKKIYRKMRREGDRGRETGLGEGEGRVLSVFF